MLLKNVAKTDRFRCGHTTASHNQQRIGYDEKDQPRVGCKTCRKRWYTPVEQRAR